MFYSDRGKPLFCEYVSDKPVDYMALEMLIGRWELDYKNRYEFIP